MTVVNFKYLYILIDFQVYYAINDTLTEAVLVGLVPNAISNVLILHVTHQKMRRDFLRNTSFPEFFLDPLITVW